MNTMTAVKPLLKIRFTKVFMWIENAILDHLGAVYYEADRVAWESHRRAAYGMWRRNINAEYIAAYHNVPIRIVNWWIEIWTRYENAWGSFK